MNKKTICIAILAIIASVMPAKAKWCRYRTYRPRRVIERRYIRRRPARRVIYVDEPYYAVADCPHTQVIEYVDYYNPKEEMARAGMNMMFDAISHACR